MQQGWRVQTSGWIYFTKGSEVGAWTSINLTKVLMQGKLFQRCTYFLYWSVLSLGGKVNTRRMSKPNMGSIFTKKSLWNILIYLFLFTNSAQRELVSICTQSIRDRNKLSLHYTFVLFRKCICYRSYSSGPTSSVCSKLSDSQSSSCWSIGRASRHAARSRIWGNIFYWGWGG